MDLRCINEFETLKSLFLKNYKKVFLNNSPKYYGCKEALWIPGNESTKVPSKSKKQPLILFCIIF